MYVYGACLFLCLLCAGSGVNRVQGVLSGFCPSKTLCRYGCMYFLAAFVLVRDGDDNATLRNASFKLTLYGCVFSVCCVGFGSFDVVCDKLQ